MEGAIPAAPKMPPLVTAQEMRRLDWWAVREFQLPLIVMTESAGRLLADLLVARLHPTRTDPIVVLAGKGGNGAGALAAARHLRHRGYDVTAVTTVPQAKLRDEAKKHLSIFRKEGGSAPPWRAGQGLPAASFLLDGILGYGITDTPKGAALELIEAANASEAPIVALDLPSGLHPDTGAAASPTIRALATLAIALPKPGLVAAGARNFVGELYLADVGFPRVLYEDLKTRPEEIFGDASLVRLPVDEGPT